MWRGARVAESGGLENRCTLTGTVGSNPTLSARIEGQGKGQRECKTIENFSLFVPESHSSEFGEIA